MPAPNETCGFGSRSEVERVGVGRTRRGRGWPSRTAAPARRPSGPARRRSRRPPAPTARTSAAACPSASAPRSRAAPAPASSRRRASCVGVAEQRPPAVAGDVHGGLVARVQQQDARADQLVLGEPLAVVDDLRQRADQVVARRRAPVPRRASAGTRRTRRWRARRSARVLLGRVQLVHPADVGRPRAAAGAGRRPARRAARRSPPPAAARRASAIRSNSPRRRRRRPVHPSCAGSGPRSPRPCAA